MNKHVLTETVNLAREKSAVVWALIGLPLNCPPKHKPKFYKKQRERKCAFAHISII